MMILWAGISLGGGNGGGALAQTSLHTLNNGLRVVIHEDHSAPVVAIQYWVGAGSRTESDMEAGITHLIEHMIFKGTPTKGPGELAWAVESAGGSINAYTSLDLTVYHVTIASRFSKLGLDVLTDAIQNASFDPLELEQEKKVVLEELRMGEDRPETRLYKALFANAYRVHPYRRPIIGYEETVSKFTREDILNYVQRLYVPENMAVIVAGDVDTGAVLGWIKGLWENWERPAKKLPDIPGEPLQDSVRAVLLRQRTTETHLRLAFPIPNARHPDVPALDLLAMILGDGESSRLEKRIRTEKRLVHTIGADSFTPLDPGLLLVHARLESGNLKDALIAIWKELMELRNDEVGQDELDRAKLQIEASLIKAKETMSGKARLLGQFLFLHGDVNYERRYLEAVKKVSTEDIKRVAQEYLSRDRLTLAVLLPEEAPQELQADELTTLLAQVHEPPQSPVTPSPSPLQPEVYREVLPNGLTLLVKEAHDVPTVSIRAVFLGGSRFEPKELPGLSKVVAHMLTRGTTSRTAQKLAQEVESLAGYLEGFSGRNSLGLEADFLSRFFPNAIEFVADCLMNATFPEEELQGERPRLMASVRRERDQPTKWVMRLFSETLFRVHPYGMRMEGTEESIASMKRDHLVEFATRILVPGNCVLAIVGDVQAQEARKWVVRHLGQWNAPPFRPPEVPVEPPMEGPREAREAGELNQVHIVLGFPGTTLNSPERYALEVLDTILSGQGGRLFRELRDKKGLAYSVTSFSRLGLDPGYFGTYIATSPENFSMALEGLRTELQRITLDEVSPEELERAKRHIIGTYEIGQQTHGAQAMTMALDERYGLGYGFGRRYLESIEAVRAKDVVDVARKYLRMDRAVTAIVGPSS